MTRALSRTWLAGLLLLMACASCGGGSASQRESEGSAAGAATEPAEGEPSDTSSAGSPTPPVDPPTVHAAPALAAHGVLAAASEVPAPSVPSPAEDARFGCGAMGRLPLGPLTSVLDNRLTIRPLAGAIAEPRAWNVMGAPEPERAESRLFLDRDGEKMVIMAHELFVTAGPDIVAQVRADAAENFPDSDVTRHDVLGEGVEALRVVPRALDTTGEAVRVLTLYVISPDRTLQVLSFYVNPRAARGGRDACLGLALRSARTLQAGTRALEVGQRVALWAGSRTLHMTLPARGVVVSQPGPDYQVHRYYDLLPLGSPSVSGFLYFGGHPANMATSPVTESHPLFGAAASFYRTETSPSTVRLELMQPVDDHLFTHVSVVSRAGAPLEPWLRALGEARFQP